MERYERIHSDREDELKRITTQQKTVAKATAQAYDAATVDALVTLRDIQDVVAKHLPSSATSSLAATLMTSRMKAQIRKHELSMNEMLAKRKSRVEARYQHLAQREMKKLDALINKDILLYRSHEDYPVDAAPALPQTSAADVKWIDVDAIDRFRSRFMPRDVVNRAIERGTAPEYISDYEKYVSQTVVPALDQAYRNQSITRQDAEWLIEYYGVQDSMLSSSEDGGHMLRDILSVRTGELLPDYAGLNEWVVNVQALSNDVERYWASTQWGNPETELRKRIVAQIKRGRDLLFDIHAKSKNTPYYKELLKKYDDIMTYLHHADELVSAKNEMYTRFSSKEAYEAAAEISRLNEMTVPELEAHNAERVKIINAEIETLREESSRINARCTASARGDRIVYASRGDEVRDGEIQRTIKALEQERDNGIAYVNDSGRNVTYDDMITAKEAEELLREMYRELSSRPDWSEMIKACNDKELGDRSPLLLQLKDMLPDGTALSGDLEHLMKRDERNVALYLLAASNKEFVQRFNLINHEYRTESDKRTEEHFARLIGSEVDESPTIDNIVGKPSASPMLSKYIDALIPVLEARRIDEHNEWWREYTEKEPFWGWVAARGANFMAGFEAIGDGLRYLGTGEMDRNMFAHTASVIDAENMANMDLRIGDWDVSDFLYGVGSSFADMALVMPLVAVHPTLVATVMGTQAFASTSNAALNRGLDDNRAFFSGLAAGVAETIFEKFSVEQLLDIKKIGVDGLQSASKEIAKSMVANASEETLTEIANSVYDILVNGDFSQFETDVRMYRQQGTGEEEAYRQALINLGVQVAEATASGALMGLPFGGGASVSSWRKSSALGKTVNDADFLVEVAKQLDDGSRARKLAAEVEAGNLKDAKLGALLAEVTAELEKKGEAKAKEIYAAAEANLEASVTEDADSFTDEDVEEFNAAVNFDATREELLDAAAKNAEAATVEAPKKSDYTPPKSAAEVKSYSDAQTDKLSRKLSRNVYKYDGSNRIDAEDGFYDAKTNSIYINKNHPLNRMSYATVLAHEYVHSLEIASEEYKELRGAVFSSSVYARYLKSAGTGERLSLTHDQYVQQIIKQYGFTGADAVERAEQEALAKVLARDFLRNESRLVELARQDRNLFMRLWAWVRRVIARLGKSEETLKLEALFRKAAKASTKAHNAKAAAQTDATTNSEVQLSKGYWHPNMTRSDVAYVERIARHEVKNDRYYIDSENKWLYNTRSGTTYFALYSTAHVDDPTVMYASKSQVAEKDYRYFTDVLDIMEKRERINEYADERATIVDEILSNSENGEVNGAVHSVDSVGRGSGAGDASVYRGNARNRPSKALLNCLENIEKAQNRRSRRDGINPSDQSGDSDRQAKYSLPDRTKSQYLGKMLADPEVAKTTTQIDTAADTASETQKHPTEDGGVQYHLPNSSESISTKDQIRTHLDELNAMESVDDISYEGTSKEAMRNRVIKKFQQLGGKIDRKNFGIIEIGESDVNTSSNYVETEAEIAAWLTVPRVLKRGILIHSKDNHKDRGHPTFTIAAPVTINGARGIVGVVVKKTGRNRYKSHRILMPDGSAFTFKHNKNAESTGSDIFTKKSEEGPDINSAFTDIILDPSEKSNPQPSEDSATGDSVQHSLPAISQEVTDAVFEEAPDTSDPSPSLQYSIALKRKTVYNEFWTEVHSWAHRATTNAGDMRVISDTRKGARPNTFCLFEADGDGDCTEIARGSYLEVLEEYERAYAKTIDEVYVCVEAYGVDKGRDIWDMPPDEIGRYALGDYDTLEGLEFQRFPAGNVEYLRSGDQEISINDDIRYSRPDQTESQDFNKMLSDHEASVMTALLKRYAIAAEKNRRRLDWLESFGENVAKRPRMLLDADVYSTAQTRVYSRCLSRAVLFYNGDEQYDAESAFGTERAVCINIKAPKTRNRLAILLGYEYVRGLKEKTEQRNALKTAVLESEVYHRVLQAQSLRHEQYVQRVAARYAEVHGLDAVAFAEQELLSNVLGTWIMQNPRRLAQLAAKAPSCFSELWYWTHKQILSLHKEALLTAEALVLEASFRRAAQASTEAHNAKATTQPETTADTASETQKHPTEDGGVQYALNITHSDGTVEVLQDARNTVRYGLPFDYLVDEVLENPNNIEVEIVRGHLARSATGEIHPNTSYNLPSDNIILDPSEKSNP